MTSRESVIQRAHDCCEYCLLPQECSDITHEIDHIISLKHSGKTVLENLALACFWCNNAKGPNVAGVDPGTGEVVRLFHPRVDQWDEHFEWNGPILHGKTPIGRTTILVLIINVKQKVEWRESLMAEGVYPLRPKVGT